MIHIRFGVVLWKPPSQKFALDSWVHGIIGILWLGHHLAVLWNRGAIARNIRQLSEPTARLGVALRGGGFSYVDGWKAPSSLEVSNVRLLE